MQVPPHSVLDSFNPTWTVTSSCDGGFMQVPTQVGKSLCMVVVLLLVSALVLSGCSGGSSPVTNTPPPPNTTAFISISPSAVMPGQSATVVWSSSNATSCTASGAWSGTLETSGSATVMLQGNTAQTYTLTCDGAGLGAKNSATLSLSPQEGSCAVGAAARARSSKRTAHGRKATPSHS